MAVRRNLYHPEEVREKIQTTQILKRLNDFIFGEVKLEKSQVAAALGLLRKTLPDLTSVAVSGTVGIEKAEDLNDAVLAHIARAGSDRAIEAANGQTEPGELH
jgi:hypothetical protein